MATKEDATPGSRKDKPLFDIGEATERVAAAVEATRKLGFPFLLTARAEGFLRGNADLDDPIKRLQAYERVGAEVLMAPGLRDLASVKAVCAALSKPFNLMAGIPGKSFSVAELEAAGVRRISLAGSLYRAAMSEPGGEGQRNVRVRRQRRCRRPRSPDSCAGERSATCDSTNSRAPSIVSSQPRRGVACSR